MDVNIGLVFELEELAVCSLCSFVAAMRIRQHARFEYNRANSVEQEVFQCMSVGVALYTYQEERKFYLWLLSSFDHSPRHQKLLDLRESST